MKTITKLILTTAILATSGWTDVVDFDTSTWAEGNAAYDAFGDQLTELFGSGAESFQFKGRYDGDSREIILNYVGGLETATGKLSLDISKNKTISSGNYTVKLENNAVNWGSWRNNIFSFSGSNYAVSLTLNTESPENCAAMFKNCGALESVIFGTNFDTSNVTSLESMFANCGNEGSTLTLTFLPEIAGSVEGVNMQYMFSYFKGSALNILGLNTNNVTDMSYMFSGCSNLTSLDLSCFDTKSVMDMNSMFSGCSQLTNIKVSKNFKSALDVNSVFPEQSVTISGGEYDPTLVALVANKYSNTLTLDGSPYVIFDTSNSQDPNKETIDNIFGNEFVYKGGIDTQNKCIILSEVKSIETDDDNGIINLNISSSTKGYSVKIENVYNPLFRMKKSYEESIPQLINGELEFVTVPHKYKAVHLTLDTAAPANCYHMFSSSTGIAKLTFGSNFNTSEILNMNSMFCNCPSLTSLDLSSFNTSNVTDMESMFSGCSGLAQLTLGDNFDTRNVMDMVNVFYACSGLGSLIVPVDFPANKNVRTGGIFDGAGSSVEGGKTTIYSTGAETAVNELFSEKLRKIVYGFGNEEDDDYYPGYDNVRLSANVPEGHADQTFERNNEITVGSGGLALGDGVVVGFADGAVLKNYGSITGPSSGTAYMRLLETATSATIINYCGGLEETDDFSYEDVEGSPKYYMLSEGSATFDGDNIEIQNRDGKDDQNAPKITVTQSGSSNIGESDEIKSKGNIIVLASAKSDTEDEGEEEEEEETDEILPPIEMSNSGDDVITVKAALANEIPESVNLASRNIKISGAFDLTASDLNRYKEGKFLAENATLTFGTSLPQTPSDFTNSNVTYQDGAEITKDITSTNGCLHFKNLKLKSGKITIKRSAN